MKAPFDHGAALAEARALCRNPIEVEPMPGVRCRAAPEVVKFHLEDGTIVPYRPTASTHPAKDGKGTSMRYQYIVVPGKEIVFNMLERAGYFFMPNESVTLVDNRKAPGA